MTAFSAQTHLQLAPLPLNSAGGLCYLNQDEFGTFGKPQQIHLGEEISSKDEVVDDIASSDVSIVSRP